MVQIHVAAPYKGVIMHVAAIYTTSDLYFDMVRTKTKKIIVNDNGEKVKEIVQTNYRPYTHEGQLDSTAQTSSSVDFYA